MPEIHHLWVKRVWSYNSIQILQTFRNCTRHTTTINEKFAGLTIYLLPVYFTVFSIELKSEGGPVI